MVTKDFTVRLGQDEIGYILDRKENLDHHSQLWDHMSRYRVWVGPWRSSASRTESI